MIPARYAASRFPGKLMQKLGDKTVIRRVYEASFQTGLFDDVIVVTDSDVIEEEIKKINGRVIRSKKEHQSGSDRIAEAAINDTISFVKTSTRPWLDSGLDHASQDPYTIQAIGDLTIRLHAAEALLEIAGRAVDAAVENPTAESVAHAQLKVAESKVLSTEVAIAATNKLFELGGTRSTLEAHNFDRHWRNARTHTLHDPVRWKYAIVGNHALNGVNPPLHAWS